MRIQYKGIALTMTGADIPLSAADLWAWDLRIICAQTTTIKGKNGVVMARLPANTPFYLPMRRRHQWGDEPQVNLNDYSANAGAGAVNVSYSERRA